MKITRRTMLRGTGITLGLPFLEAMRLPAAAKPPVRMAFFFVPNGQNMDGWRMPKTPGLPETLLPLKPVADKILILSGLAHKNGEALGDGPGDHARDSAVFLTGMHPKKTDGKDIRAGVSADQFAAKQIGNMTRIPSLELGTQGGAQSGGCDSGYSCAYSSNISWQGPSSAMAKETNARNLFIRLFGDPQARSSEQDKVREATYLKSALDLVLEDAKALRAKLGAVDQEKVDEYLESVRHIEKGIQSVDKAPKGPPPGLTIPDGRPGDHAQHIRLLMDLMVAAFQTDSTRIATFMLANSGSNNSFPDLSINDGHHTLSHHGRDTGKTGKIQKIDLFYMQQMAYLFEKMNKLKEERGTLLDNSMVVYGGAISDGDRHNHDDLPVLLAGKGGGTIPTGRQMKANGQPMCNLFLSMFARAGVKAASFGDSTKPLVL